jgi:hypothetical protein
LGRIALALILFLGLIWTFGITLDAVHNIQTDEVTDAALPCISDPEDVVLTHDLWNDDIASVLSAVDSEGNILTATNYVPATNTLTVTGWVTPATTCAIVYEIDGLTSWTGFAQIVAFSPLLAWVFFALVLPGVLAWSGIRQLQGG